jgi:hypothetical protein
MPHGFTAEGLVPEQNLSAPTNGAPITPLDGPVRFPIHS